MIILTCANIDVAPDEYGKWYKGFSFKNVISETVRKAKSLGYTPIVYDLGSLGIGEPFYVDDLTFKTKGYYDTKVLGDYKSRSLFKPEIVKRCMNTYNDIIVYLDGDAQLYDSIDEVKTEDYDIGVTLRDPSEFESNWYQKHFEIVKYVNAGVIFFRPTEATKKFLDSWKQMTKNLGNDQMALNKLTCPDNYPAPNTILTINGIRIKYFPCTQYNFYYFDTGINRNIKIMHFKGMVRHFYPFDWKKRLYCMTVAPLLNKIRPFIKNLLRIL
jgi:hypothetical protein